jgi:hypothetical protein
MRTEMPGLCMFSAETDGAAAAAVATSTRRMALAALKTRGSMAHDHLGENDNPVLFLE